MDEIKKNKTYDRIVINEDLEQFFVKNVEALDKFIFNNIDLLIHEYGHFVQYTMGTYGSDLLEMWKNDPSHSVSADHFSEGRDKEYAMELTWSEAWATTFSFIA